MKKEEKIDRLLKEGAGEIGTLSNRIDEVQEYWSKSIGIPFEKNIWLD